MCVRSDWRQREKVIRPDMLELQARRNGITRVEVAQALQAALRDASLAFTASRAAPAPGIYPQETRLLANRRPSRRWPSATTSA